MNSICKRNHFARTCTAFVVVFVATLSGAARSRVAADDAAAAADVVLASGQSCDSCDAFSRQMMPLPDWSSCDGCDQVWSPLFGEECKPPLGARIHDWWETHVRKKHKKCYYRSQKAHRKFFNPVVHPCGPPYGYYGKIWTPFPECYSMSVPAAPLTVPGPAE